MKRGAERSPGAQGDKWKTKVGVRQVRLTAGLGGMVTSTMLLNAAP